MAQRLKIVLLYGGRSGEHEVSLRSAASVLTQLDENKYEVIPVGMDKEGCFYLNEYDELKAFPQELPVKTAKSQALASLWLYGRFAIEADAVFPVVHGPLYEDGCLQGFLKLAGIAWVGSDVLASAIAMDKDMARRVICNASIPCATYVKLSCHSKNREELCQQAAESLGWPIFVKPCTLGSSVGIHKVENHEALMNAVADAFCYDEEILLEEALVGREIELAVLEHSSLIEPPLVSLAGEIKVNHPDGFYSYAAKYLESEKTDLMVPASLSANHLQRLQVMAADIFQRLKCKGMARVDFFLNEETDMIYFNEINTLPGFTSISMYPKLWMASGLAYPLLLEKLIDLALAHQRSQKQRVTNYQ